MTESEIAKNILLGRTCENCSKDIWGHDGKPDNEDNWCMDYHDRENNICEYWEEYK